MYLQSISLRQFRNHTDLELAVDPGLNLFLGPNGTGKTNLVEAIAVLATGISPRGAESDDMIQWGSNGFGIRGSFAHEIPGLDPLLLEMKVRAGLPRVIRRDGHSPLRLKDLMGLAPLVSFVPEDLALVKGEPELRRRALNLILMQVDALYAENLRRYNEALKARNSALKQVAEARLSLEALTPWNQALVRVGLPLCEKRASFLLDFSDRVADIHERLSGGKERVRLEYKPSFQGPWAAEAQAGWLERMSATLTQEMAVGTTLVGPHRDDALFLLNGRPARAYASEGQKRTAAVSFKLAEVSYIDEKIGQKPICLLDDVLSELDAERAAYLLNELSQTGQCFVTMTGLESWPRHCQLPASIFQVDEKGIRANRALEEAKALSKEDGVQEVVAL